MNDRWLKDIHDRMAGFETEEPAGLWNEIENDLDRRRRAVFPFRLVAGIAAMVALVAGLWFVGRQQPDLSTAGHDAPEAPVFQTGPTADAEATATATTSAAVAETRPTPAAAAAGSSPTESFCQTAAGDKAAATPVPAPVTENVPVRESGENGVAPRAGSDTVADIVAAQPAVTAVPARETFRSAKNTASRLSVSLSTSGALSSSTRDYSLGDMLTGVDPNGDILWNDNPLLGMIMMNKGKTVYTNTSHRLPVRAALTFGLRLTDRLTAETGVTFTRLTSDISEGSERNYMSGTQKIDYVGVPLTLRCRVFSWKFIDLYGSAGVLGEKSVAGKIEKDYYLQNRYSSTVTENIAEQPLQWSVNASAGVQLNVARFAGVFAEPGLSYYFDSGSTVRTVYSDRPLNFNLNVGVRLTFGR